LSGEVLAWLSVWTLERGADDLHQLDHMQIICTSLQTDNRPSGVAVASAGPYAPIIFCSSKMQNGLPFRCRLTQDVLKKGR